MLVNKACHIWRDCQGFQGQQDSINSSQLTTERAMVLWSTWSDDHPHKLSPCCLSFNDPFCCSSLVPKRSCSHCKTVTLVNSFGGPSSTWSDHQCECVTASLWPEHCVIIYQYSHSLLPWCHGFPHT